MSQIYVYGSNPREWRIWMNSAFSHLILLFFRTLSAGCHFVPGSTKHTQRELFPHTIYVLNTKKKQEPRGLPTLGRGIEAKSLWFTVTSSKHIADCVQCCSKTMLTNLLGITRDVKYCQEEIAVTINYHDHRNGF